MSELTFACGLCGNTNEPSYVSTSFGESCLFLLSGSKRKVKTLESVCPVFGCATTKCGTGLVPSDALVLALEIIGREVCKFRAISFGLEAGKPLASSKRVAKVAFTGETTTGRLIMQYAAQNIIPITLELGGKSPNIFFEDIMDKDDDFLDKCVEGFVMFNLNQGEVCTCPSRALVQESIYDKFMEKCIARTKAVIQDNPLKMETMIGAQASVEQMEKIKSYLDLGKKEGAKVLAGGDVGKLNSGLEKGNYIQPTIFETDNKSRISQEEIFGPVVSVIKFKDEAEALKIANDTLYGLGAAVWTRNGNIAHRMGREIQAGIVWTNCYHAYPAHSPFGGYKQSGVGRETHKMMLNHYRQNKNLHVSYAEQKLGFF
jgi:aldehyde dehydrogenase